ncbi:MAG TPA: DUF302 domain-containing protein [Ktedonobacterales bacterium]
MQTNETPTPSSEIASPSYGFGRTLDTTVEDAIARVTEALKSEGFGVLTTIDVQATLKAKLGVDQEPYVILGTCNPPLAHRALSADANAGLLLPCNVVVRALPAVNGQPRARIEFADPVSMLSIMQAPGLDDLASEARAKLERVAAALA